MSEQTQRPAWMEDELVRNIPREKLDLLSRLFTEADARRRSAGPESSQKDLMLRLMPLLKQAKSAGLGFTAQEMQAAVAAIRKYSTREELKEIDQLLQKTNHTQQTPS